jgi:hypothetical protein
MISFQKSYNLTLAQAREPYRMIAYCREVAADATKQYNIARTGTDVAQLALIGKSQFDSLVGNLDPSLSLPVMKSEIGLPFASAAVRIDEIYHLTQGLLYNLNQDPKALITNSFGMDLKILKFGQQDVNEVELQSSTDSQITVSHPIASQASISAEAMTDSLTVTDAALGTGVITLEDSGSPLEDGTNVSVVYQSQQWCVFDLLDSDLSIQAVLCTQALVDYLKTNANS